MVSAIAIRGERLVLARVRASGRDPDAIRNEALNVIEIDTMIGSWRPLRST